MKLRRSPSGSRVEIPEPPPPAPVEPALVFYNGDGFPFQSETTILELPYSGAGPIEVLFSLQVSNAGGFSGAPAAYLLRFYVDDRVCSPTGFIYDFKPSNSGEYVVTCGSIVALEVLEGNDPVPIGPGPHVLKMTAQNTDGVPDALAVPGVLGPSPIFLGVKSWG